MTLQYAEPFGFCMVNMISEKEAIHSVDNLGMMANKFDSVSVNPAGKKILIFIQNGKIQREKFHRGKVTNFPSNNFFIMMKLIN